jgi:hypothetical protein
MNTIGVNNVLEVLGNGLGDELNRAKNSKCLAKNRPKLAQEADRRVFLGGLDVRRYGLDENGQEFYKIFSLGNNIVRIYRLLSYDLYRLLTGPYVVGQRVG